MMISGSSVEVKRTLLGCDVINLLSINTGYAFLCNVDYTASHPKTTIFVVILFRSCYNKCLHAHPQTFFYILFHILMSLINVHGPG
jgi:hypothetical protein